MAGLVPAIHVFLLGKQGVDARHKAGHDRGNIFVVVNQSQQRIVKVVPLRIRGKDQPDLPRPRPMLEVLFTLNSSADVVVDLEINEAFEPVSFGKSLHRAFAVLSDPLDKIACDAGIQDAVRIVCEDIHIAGPHACSVANVDGRDKPGHDGERSYAN
jgi:hypothetical protein